MCTEEEHSIWIPACQGRNVREHVKGRAAMRAIECMWCTDKSACFDEMLIAAYLPCTAFINATSTAWEGNGQPPSNDLTGASWPQCLPMAIRPIGMVPASATAHQQQQIALLACSALHKHKSSHCEACIRSVWHARSLSTRAMTPQYHSMYHKAYNVPSLPTSGHWNMYRTHRMVVVAITLFRVYIISGR